MFYNGLLANEGTRAWQRVAIVIALVASARCVAATTLHPAVVKAQSAWAQDALAAPVFCGDLVKIAYDPAKIADASPMYFNNVTGAVVAICDNPMVTRGQPVEKRVPCPPVEWVCAR